jgi:hypothetical protein
MPPQQPDRLLDLFYQPFDFGAHGCFRVQNLLERDIALKIFVCA